MTMKTVRVGFVTEYQAGEEYNINELVLYGGLVKRVTTRIPRGTTATGSEFSDVASTGGSGAPSRTTATLTTGTLAPSAYETGTIPLSKSYRLLNVQFSSPARIRLYSTVAQRDADVARAMGIDPIGNHGLMFEQVATSILFYDLSPQIDGYDGKASPDGNIPYTITNLDSSNRAITFTTKYLVTET